MIKSKIVGVGYYLPDNVVSNKDLEESMDTSDEWIRERTGIKERRWIKEDSKLSTSLMGTYAAKDALSDANTVLNLKYLKNVLYQAKTLHKSRLDILKKCGKDNVK